MKKIYALFAMSCFLYGCGSGSDTTTESKAVAPPIPQGLVATSGSNFVDLVWEASEGADLYQIYRDDVLLIGITRLSYRDTEVKNSTAYRYAVAAVNKGTASSRTPIASATPAPLGDLNPPATVSAEFIGPPTDLSAKVSWSAIDNADAYNVYRNGELIATITTSTYTDEEVEADTQYEYSISAVNSEGEGTVSPVQMINSTDVVGLLPPTGLSATVGDNLVELSWDAVSEATLYHLYRDDNPLASLSFLRFTDREVEGGTTYSYSISASKDGAEGDQNTLAIMVTLAAPPTAPMGLTAAPSDDMLAITLSWDMVTGADLYNIYRSEPPAVEQTLLGQASLTSFSDTTATSEIDYNYTVSALGPSGEGDQSTAVMARLAAPAAPANFSTVAGNGIVALTWDAVGSGNSYRIYRDDNPLYEIKVNGFIDNQVTNDQTYSYTVSTFNGAGEGARTPAMMVTPVAPAIPMIPTGLMALPGRGSVRLSWTNVMGVELYKVYRNGILLITLSNNVHADTTAVFGTSYAYTVSSLHNSVESMPSVSITATPSEPAVTPAPNAPQNLRASAGNKSVTLTWESVTDALQYIVYRDDQRITRIGATDEIAKEAYTDSGVALVNGEDYTYVVSAVGSEDQESRRSNEVVATPAAPTLPEPPTGLTAMIRVGLVVLNWQVVEGADAYRIYRNDDQPILIDATEYTDAFVVSNTLYTYEVATIDNVAGESTTRTRVEITTPPTLDPVQPPATPDAPANLMATPGNAVVTLSWDAVAGANLYGVYRDGNLLTQISLTTFTDTGLTNGTSYSYTVASFVGAQRSVGLSNPVTVTPVAPPAPADLVATPSNGEVALTWTAVENVQLYRVYRDARLLAQPATNSYTDTSVSNGTPYTYYVVSIRDGGEGPSSAEVTATPREYEPVAGNHILLDSSAVTRRINARVNDNNTLTYPQSVEVNWAPLQIKPTRATATEIDIAWDELKGASAYVVTLTHQNGAATAQDSTTIDNPTDNPATTRHTFSGIQDSYYPLFISLSAINASGQTSLASTKGPFASLAAVQRVVRPYTSRKVKHKLYARQGSYPPDPNVDDGVVIVNEDNVVPPATLVLPNDREALRTYSVQVEITNITPDPDNSNIIDGTRTFSNELAVNTLVNSRYFPFETASHTNHIVALPHSSAIADTYNVVVGGANALYALNMDLSERLTIPIPNRSFTEATETDATSDAKLDPEVLYPSSGADSGKILFSTMPNNLYVDQAEPTCITFHDGGSLLNPCENHLRSLQYQVDVDSFHYCGNGLRYITDEAFTDGHVQCYAFRAGDLSDGSRFSRAGYNGADANATLNTFSQTPYTEPDAYLEYNSEEDQFTRIDHYGMLSGAPRNTEEAAKDREWRLFQSSFSFDPSTGALLDNSFIHSRISGTPAIPASESSTGNKIPATTSIAPDGWHQDLIRSARVVYLREFNPEPCKNSAPCLDDSNGDDRGDFVFYFFRGDEKKPFNSSSVDLPHSYIGRVCQDDEGIKMGESDHQNLPASYMYARLYTELEVPPGGNTQSQLLDFQYNYIAAVDVVGLNAYMAFNSTDSSQIGFGAALTINNFLDSASETDAGFSRNLFDIFREDLSDISDTSSNPTGVEVQNDYTTCHASTTVGTTGAIDRPENIALHANRGVQAVDQITENPLLVLGNESATSIAGHPVGVLDADDATDDSNEPGLDRERDLDPGLARLILLATESGRVYEIYVINDIFFPHDELGDFGLVDNFPFNPQIGAGGTVLTLPQTNTRIIAVHEIADEPISHVIFDKQNTGMAWAITNSGAYVFALTPRN